jgi:pimeloyl-ACP methyl ester carboxylesterase
MIWSLVILLLTVPMASAQVTRTVRLNSADGVALSATYYPSPTTNSAPAVILLHGFTKNRQEWSNFALALQHAGIAALALDLRGHGDSTRQITPDGVETLEAKNLLPRDFVAMTLDVEAAYNWLADMPGINPHRIAIAGSSVSANVALRYVQFNDEVAALILLSPGTTYKGLRVDDIMARIRPVPLRIAVSAGDAYSYESSKRLMEIRHETHPTTKPDEELLECGGPLHGVTMFAGIKNLAPALVYWLKQVLLPAP